MRPSVTFAVLLAAVIAGPTLYPGSVHAKAAPGFVGTPTVGRFGDIDVASNFVQSERRPAWTADQAGDRNRPAPPPRHFSGLINDYTPSAAVVGGGPYEMHGSWSLEMDERRGTASFLAVMNMETSDYGITQGTVNKDDPATRSAHTHHMSMTDAVVSADWAASCPKFNPAATDGFVVTGSVFVTGNGSGAPFGNPSPLTVCVLGGAVVKFSNLTMTLGKPAANHFGLQAIHGVVSRCTGRLGTQSNDCTVDE
ncbi:MAG: hypothetical protein ABI818_08985 [Acidobacteriota bacterium]